MTWELYSYNERGARKKVADDVVNGHYNGYSILLANGFTTASNRQPLLFPLRNRHAVEREEKTTKTREGGSKRAIKQKGKRQVEGTTDNR
jgi:hypothetical protein